MNDPRRLLDPMSGAPVARSLLRVGVDMGPPPGAKEQVWGTLSVALGAGAAVAGASLAAPSLAAPSLAAPSLAAPSATPSSPGAPPVPNPVAVTAGKIAPLKLVAGKWILLSSLAIVAAGGAAYRLATKAPAVPIALASGAPAPAVVDAERAPAPSTDEGSPGAANGRTASDRGDAHAGVESAPAGALAEPPAVDRGILEPVPKGGNDANREKPLASPVAPKAAPNEAALVPEGRSSSLAEESAALAGARGRLKSGDAAGAVQALQEMDGRFGGGGLAQERTALLIQALAQSGQRDAAARYADAFLAAYPSSPLTARVRPFATQ